MRIKQLFLFTFFLTATVTFGQVADKFGKFAIKQDSLFIIAYKQKDIKT
jgi:hypothetical protein